VENLLAGIRDAEDRGVRANLSTAALVGALAFQKGIGVAHSLAHQLSILKVSA
jgi:alcohol dehydrogenase class IV